MFITERLGQEGDVLACAEDSGIALLFRIRRTSSDSTAEGHGMVRLQAAVAQVWSSCASLAGVPSLVINLQSNANGQTEWEANDERELYHAYQNELVPLESLLAQDSQIVQQSDLVRLDRPSVHPRRIVSHVASNNPDSEYVCHSISFLDALVSWPDFLRGRDNLYRTIRLLRTIPPHPSIIQPSRYIALDGLVTGMLIPHFPTLASELETSVSLSLPIPLATKSRWIFALCSALYHAHLVHAHPLSISLSTLSIQPGTSRLLIPDWTNRSASRTTLAPEADGNWVIAGPDPEKSGQLIYTPYSGPTRSNIPFWPGWDVFQEWSTQWPRAAEAATVWAAGRTMCYILDYGREEDEDEEVEDMDERIRRRQEADTVPGRWREMLGMCLQEDPNRRIRLADLARFWEREQDR